MVFTRTVVTLLVAGSIVPGVAAAHELWLEPSQPRYAEGDLISVSLRVGQNLAGEEIPNLPQLQAAVDLSVGADRFAVPSRVGDVPAFNFEARDDALLVLRYQSVPNFLTYGSDGDFIKFLDEVQRPDILETWQAAHVPGAPITEVFTRYAKALIPIGMSPGGDVALGMPFELVLLENPFDAEAEDSLTYSVLRDGQPAPYAPFHVFHRDVGSVVNRLEGRADENGMFKVTVEEAGFYLISAIDFSAADAQSKAQFGAQWQSDWASSSLYIE